MFDKHKKQLIFFILLTIACAITIFMLSSQERAVSSANSLNVLTHLAELLGRVFGIQVSREQILGLHNFFRKTAHFSAYTILSIFSYNVFRLLLKQKKHTVVATLTFCVVMAISDEIHQIFVPGRLAEVRDVLIDTLGVCFGLGIVWIANMIGKKLRRKESLPK